MSARREMEESGRRFCKAMMARGVPEATTVSVQGGVARCCERPGSWERHGPLPGAGLHGSKKERRVGSGEYRTLLMNHVICVHSAIWERRKEIALDDRICDQPTIGHRNVFERLIDKLEAKGDALFTGTGSTVR